MKNLIFIITVSILLLSCSGVRYTYDKSTDFTKYKTFVYVKKGMYQSKLPSVYKKIIAEEVHSYIINEGLKPTSSQPDIMIDIIPEFHKRIDVYPSPYGKKVYKSKDGTLSIRFLDARSKKIIWEAKTHLNFKNKKELSLRLRKKLDKIFTHYPPQKN